MFVNIRRDTEQSDLISHVLFVTGAKGRETSSLPCVRQSTLISVAANNICVARCFCFVSFVNQWRTIDVSDV